MNEKTSIRVLNSENILNEKIFYYD